MNFPYSIPYQLTNEEANGLAARCLPLQFKGKIRLNLDVIHGYRAFIKNNPNSKNIVSIEHIDAIAPLTEDLKKYIVGDSASPDIRQKFLDEIMESETKKRINPLWLVFAYLRYAAATSDISKDERNLFSHLVNSRILTGLLKKNAWMDHYTTLQSILFTEDLGSTTQYSYLLENIHYSMLDVIDNEMIQYFPTPVYYPFSGIGKFGICFMIQCYINQVFPLGLPAANKFANRVQAHGAGMSRVSFLVHDTLHADVDPRRNALKGHIAKECDAFVSQGGDASIFVKYYTPQAVKLYLGLMYALQEILNSFLKLLPNYGKEEFQRTMVGFFLLIHEHPAYDSNTFARNDLNAIIHKFVQHGKSALRSKYSWQSTFDPLQTSPLNGKSKFNKAEIYKLIVELYLADDSRISLPISYYKNSPPPDRGDYIKQLISGFTTKNSDRFVDVEITLRTGQRVKYSSATLYHKWTNLDDSIALLKMAGVHIVKPDISGLGTEVSRKVAIETIRTVRRELIKVLEHFKCRAQFVINQNHSSEQTLATRFFNWHFHNTARINVNVEKAIRSYKLG